VKCVDSCDNCKCSQDVERTSGYTLSLTFPGVDGQERVVVTKDLEVYEFYNLYAEYINSSVTLELFGQE